MKTRLSFINRVVGGIRVAAGLLAISGPFVAHAAMPFFPGDIYQVKPDTGFYSRPADLFSLGSETLKFTFEEGTYTDFTFQDKVGGAFLGVQAWARRFPDFDYVINALNPDGEGLFLLRQASGHIVFQETVGTPAMFHQTALDPGNGFKRVHSVKFLRGDKRVTLLKGPDGGFLVDETIGDVTRLAWFDAAGNLVTEWATENHRFVDRPRLAAVWDGSLFLTGEVEPLLQAAGSGEQKSRVVLEIRKSGSQSVLRVTERGLTRGLTGLIWVLDRIREIKDRGDRGRNPVTVFGIMPFLVAIADAARPAPLVHVSLQFKRPTRANPDSTAGPGLVAAWVDENLTMVRGILVSGLNEHDPFRQFSVSAGRGNEIVLPARMEDPAGGASFVVLFRLDLDAGKVLESVRFKLDEELTMTSLEYRRGNVFAALRGTSVNYLLKCDPLHLAGLKINRVANVTGRVFFNFPDDPMQPLNATWSDAGTPGHFVAAFDDQLRDTLCLDFETVPPVVVESFMPTVNDLGSEAGAPAEVLVEQAAPLWRNLLQPNDRSLTLTHPVLDLVRTCEALRLVGAPDGAGRLRVRFPSVAGHNYQLRSASNPAGLSSPGAIVETIAGTGNEIVRLFDRSRPEQFFAVTAVPAL